MKILLISGAPNTGKTTITTMIERYLRSIGFRNYCRRYEISENDSAIVLEGANINGKTIRILLNTPSDTIGIIDEVYDYYQQNSSVDFVITTVRDMYEERNYLFETFNINNYEYYEIPLARVTRRNDNEEAKENYFTRVLDLVKHILSMEPFYIS